MPMKPVVESTRFGCITINGQDYEKDIVIRSDGTIEKRNKKLSKEQYGTSHTVSQAEAAHIFGKGAEKVIIGSGQYGVLELSSQAWRYFRDKGCDVKLLPTPDAVEEWNDAHGNVVSMFHITC